MKYDTHKSLTQTTLFIGLSFLWTGSCYLTWMYRVSELFPASTTDILTEIIGYLFQALGIFLFTYCSKKYHRESLPKRMEFVLLIILDLFSLLIAITFPAKTTVLLFGYLMNLFHGCIAGFYLEILTKQISQQKKALVFGTGYAIGSIGSWLLSLIGPTNFLQNHWVLFIYPVLAFLTLPLLTNLTFDSTVDSINKKTLPQAAMKRKHLLLVSITVLLLSLVKNIGFYFPSTDFSNTGFSLEFSRIFYALGLIAAGLINDKNRKYGAQYCLAALFFPFLLFFLRNQVIASGIVWALGYLFFGFFTVYRVIVFSDFANKAEYALFYAFGLMFGRLGDAAGALLGILLCKHILVLFSISGILFLVTVFCFFEFYQAFYFPVLSIEKTQEMLIDSFAEQYQFTPREKDVFALITRGRSNSEIAGDLFVSENTVKYHMKNILRKASCANRIELISLYKRQ